MIKLYEQYTHNERSKVFKILFIVSIIVIFILGIISGNMFDSYEFNWMAAIMIWISGVIPVAILYAIYAHLENQEIQINNLNKIRKELACDSQSAHKQTAEKSKTCPMCHTENPIDARRCINCQALI